MIFSPNSNYNKTNTITFQNFRGSTPLDSRLRTVSLAPPVLHFWTILLLLPLLLPLLHTARQSHKKHTEHTNPAATTYCSSNPHKNLQNIHMLLLKFSKISMLLQFVQIHTNSNLLKPSARLRAQKNPTSNPQSRCVQLLCYRGTHTNSIIANCTFIAHFEGTGS